MTGRSFVEPGEGNDRGQGLTALPWAFLARLCNGTGSLVQHTAFEPSNFDRSRKACNPIFNGMPSASSLRMNASA